jgi:small-conductance mechanosensitive channel
LTTEIPFARLRLKRFAVYSLTAITCIAVSAAYGDINSDNDAKKAVGIGAAVLFVVVGVAAVHRLAAECSRVVRARTGGTAAATVEVTVSAVGYIIVLVVALDLLEVSLENFLLGGAITGIVLGIALQQILGNVFAGVALLLAHPFNIGDRILLRSGAYGGEVIGRVRSVNLTYVVLETDNGLLHVPNAGVLASAISSNYVPPQKAAEGDASP